MGSNRVACFRFKEAISIFSGGRILDMAIPRFQPNARFEPVGTRPYTRLGGIVHPMHSPLNRNRGFSDARSTRARRFPG
jgi:hypothetical protein